MQSVIVGAKETTYPGWQSTDLRAAGARLDVRRAEDWARSFAPDSIDRIVAEHVLEHMTLAEALAALCNARRHLKQGGHIRVAVPDAFNPDPVYQEMCRPGGRGQSWSRLFVYTADEPEHKTHYSYRMLAELMQRAGLRPRLLEWFDERRQFHRQAWSVDDGPVKRYFGSPYNLKVFRRWHGYQNLSLIVDGVKETDDGGARAEDFCAVEIGSGAARMGRPAVRDSTGEIVVLGGIALFLLLGLRSKQP